MSAPVTDGPRKGPAWDMVVVSLISLWLAYWFIPEQIPAVDALGLAPELLPQASAVGMMVLSALGFLLSLVRGAPPLEMAGTTWGPVCLVMGLCTVGVGIMSYASLAVGALFIVPALMRVLGERRWTRLLLTALIVAVLVHFVAP